MARGVPVLLRGLAREWPAFERWPSLDYLEERLGAASIPVSLFATSRFDDAERVRVEMSFDELRRRGLEPPLSELVKVTVGLRPEARPGLGILLDDILLPASIPVPIRPRLFLGRDFATQLHYHYGTEAILCSVVGTKRVFLFHPSDTRRLYLNPWNQRLFNVSRMRFDFDSTEFDAEQFPRARGLEVTDVEVQSGDALYIPLYWPHLVFAYGLSMAITMFWNASLLRRLASPLVLRRNYLGMYR